MAVLVVLVASLVTPPQTRAQGNPAYTTYANFADLMTGNGVRYPKLIRISEPGTRDRPDYTGFFFYQCLQFDPTDRYVLGLRVHCQNRDVRPTDRVTTSGGMTIPFSMAAVTICMRMMEPAKP